MAIKTFLIPPSSHFLKTLANFLLAELSFSSPEISGFYILFPTKRATYFFRDYLVKKVIPNSIFLPKILAWEDFSLELYLKLTPSPKMLLPEEAKILLFIESLNDEKLSQDPRSLLYWGTRFLEVFDEFEKEGKVPSMLLYPPENLPQMAQDLFEELTSTYYKFKNLLAEKKIIFPSLLLSDIRSLLLERKNILPSFIRGLVLAGFAALRNSEKEVIKTLIDTLNQADFPIYLFFAEEYPPHPLIQETLQSFNLEVSLIPETYLEIPLPDREIKLFSFPDPESEVSKVLELIQSPIKEYDKTAIILPLPLMLLPLYQHLENLDMEINITLPFPSKFLSLCQFMQLLLKAQREKIRAGIYPLDIIKKIFNYPILKALFRKKADFDNFLQRLNKVLEDLKFYQIEINELSSHLEPPYKEFFKKLVEIFLENFEHLKSPQEVKKALHCLVELAKPLFDAPSCLEELLAREYIAFIERNIFSLLDYEPLWNNFPLKDKELFHLSLLDYLLSTVELPLVGEPLAGLQIMGFLEGRLLYFDRVIILDVNEGSLPPQANINPLLTDEIKRYLGLPIFKNDLWDYYFKCLINSGKEINLFYISTSKGKGDLVKEPSRYILKYKWQLEKENKTPCEEIFKPPIVIKVPKKEIPKSKNDLETIRLILKNMELSRSFFETYLNCPAKFYFQYLLGLKPLEETSITDKDIGNFLHKYFETLFRAYLNKSLSFTHLLDSQEWKKTFEELWSKANFEKRLDPLSLWLTEKVTKACIQKYFEYLKNAEREELLKETIILGVEKELKYKIIFNAESLTLYGRIDFIVKRKENNIVKYIIFDFKTNPYKKPYVKSIDTLLRAKLPYNFTKEELFYVRELFGNELTNFQLLFYLFLFLKHKSNFIDEEQFSLDTGFLTPANLKEPESFLFKKRKRAELTQITSYLEKEFEKLLDWILRHLYESPCFYYFDEEESCKYCPYKSPCQNLRY